MSRRIIKPKRRRHHSRGHEKDDDDDDDNHFAASIPSGSGVKRKCEDWEEIPTKRSRRDEESHSGRPLKYSANDRLDKYRKALDQRKHQVVKVHKAVCNNVEAKRTRRSPTSRDAAVATSASLLQHLPEKVLAPRMELETIHFNTNISGLNNNQSVIHHSSTDDYEDMDWNPVNEDELAADIRKLRSTIKSQPSSLFLNVTSDNRSSSGRPLAADDPLYVVVDTNIFISHLNLIKDISKLHHVSKLKPIIYVPWMVLQELDFFKDGRAGSAGAQNAARRAVSFINAALMSKSRALKGQTVREALSHDFTNSNPDDNILFCCLKLQQDRLKIILLSNDQNLRSKMMVHSIEAHSTKTIMDVFNAVDKRNYMPRLETKQDLVRNSGPTDVRSSPKAKPIKPDEPAPAEKVAQIVVNACTEIVRNELEKAYGETVYKMIAKPPWTLEDCLNYIKRFWIPVFSLIITQKQCLKTVDDLLEYVKVHNGGVIEPSEDDPEEFVKLALSLCVYFKNCLSPYESLMKACISDIQKALENV